MISHSTSIKNGVTVHLYETATGGFYRQHDGEKVIGPTLPFPRKLKTAQTVIVKDTAEEVEAEITAQGLTLPAPFVPPSQEE
jgi:hypothetical protein